MTNLQEANKYWEEIKEDIEFDLSIIIPAYNEEKRISKTLDEIINYFSDKSYNLELIVVDDGSKDKTAEIILNYSEQHSFIKLLKQETNVGKGFAVKGGVLSSRGKIVLFADADGATPIVEIERLLEEINNDGSVVIGSRAKPSNITRIKTVWYRKIIGRCFNFLVNSFILPGLYDTQCGFKMFKAEAAHKIFFLQKTKQFSFDLEILFLAKKLGFKIIEVAINWQNVEGSKVNIVKDSIKMFKDIFIIRLIHKNL